MKRVFVLVLVFLFSFAIPVQAGMVEDFAPVEKELVDAERYEYKTEKKPKSNWWKWALGLVVVGGVTAAALGGGGDDGGGNGGDDAGSVIGTW